MERKTLGISFLVGIFVFFTAGLVQAITLVFDLDPFTGDAADAIVTVDDNTDGYFRVHVEVLPESSTGNVGDITGVFFNLSPLISEEDLTCTIGGPIIGFGNNTNNLGGGVNLHGGGPNNPGLFDVGIRFFGFNIDDVQEVEFLICAIDTLHLNDFHGFGLRLQTVGPFDDHRCGSSKLFCSSAVPIPSAVWLLGSGLIGLMGVRRQLKKSES